MDYNQYQAFYGERPTKAADFRRVAREALKGFWLIAVLVTIVAWLFGAISGISVNADVVTNGFFTDFIDGFFYGITGETMSGKDYNTTDADFALTPEQMEIYEEAYQNLDLKTMGEIIAYINPISGFLIANLFVILFALPLFCILFAVFVSSPIKVGYQKFCLEVLEGNDHGVKIRTLFLPFKKGYGKTIVLNIVHSLLMSLTWIPMIICTVIGFVSFFAFVFSAPADVSILTIMDNLFTLFGFTLFGLVISVCINLPVFYMYSMAHIIMADSPEVGAIEALRLSRKMMKGNKWRLFCLNFSFIGWALLAACCTCGIGYFFLTPYQYVANAAFYHEISGRKTHEEVEVPGATSDGYIIE